MTGDSRKKTRLKDSRITKRQNASKNIVGTWYNIWIFFFIGRKLKDIKIVVLKIIEILGNTDVCTSYN